MIDLATAILTGAGIVAGAGGLTGHAWRSRRLTTRFDAFIRRLDDVETAMYTHEEPAESVIRAPAFDLPDHHGAPVSLARLLARGKPVLLVFTDAAGMTGRSLLATIERWQRAHQEPLTAVGIGSALSADAPPKRPAGVAELLVDEQRRVARSFGIALTPAVVLIRSNGAIVGTPTVGIRGIQNLLESIASAAADAARIRQEHVEGATPEIGTPAPFIRLPDLDDVDRDLMTGGTAQVLLFWSPDCGYCDQLAPELHLLQMGRDANAPAITLVTRGSEAANRGQGFGFRTLLDLDLSASTAFGSYGTPAAIMVDADGKVASPLARGIRAVRELLDLNGASLRQHPHRDR